MLSVFALKSSDPPSCLTFSDKSEDVFYVTVEQPGLKATKEISLNSYLPDNSFVEFFQRLASFDKPWTEEVVWEPLEGGMKLSALCDGLGHVTLEIELRDGPINDWSLNAPMGLEFGHLPRYAEHARRFMALRASR